MQKSGLAVLVTALLCSVQQGVSASGGAHIIKPFDYDHAVGSASVEQAFRPAVKLQRESASAAEVPSPGSRSKVTPVGVTIR